jgi:hypothetical protein
LGQCWDSISGSDEDFILLFVLAVVKGCKSSGVAVDFAMPLYCQEDVVKRYGLRSLLFCFALSIFAGSFAWGQQPPAEQQPASVAGKWTLYCKDPNGSTSSKFLELQQKGSVISGHFKGPNQSGGVEGTIDNQHLVVRTKTRDVLTFRGRVDGPRVEGVVQGNTFNGNFHDRGGTGSFQGVRSN